VSKTSRYIILNTFLRINNFLFKKLLENNTASDHHHSKFPFSSKAEKCFVLSVLLSDQQLLLFLIKPSPTLQRKNNLTKYKGKFHQHCVNPNAMLFVSIFVLVP